jgi:hypothetical protein
MTISCVLHQCRSFDCSRLSSTRKIPLSQSLHMKYEMSMFHSRVSVCVFNDEFNFTYHFLICMYILMHITETSNLWQVVKIYGVLKDTVWCHFFLVGTLGGGIREWEAVCPGFWRRSKLQHHQPCSVGLKLWTIYQECLYQGVLLKITAHGLLT